MHFSIPDTLEISYTENSTYTVYNIYLNGFFHCSLRYKQLHSLHEQLQKHCAEIGVHAPIFPPKRLLPLTTNQIEIRRLALEQYLQHLGQDTRIAKLQFLQNFLLNAQFETATRIADERNEEDLRYATVKLDIWLMSGHQVKIENIRVNSNASSLLRHACDLLNLPKHLVSYFGLFLARKEAKNTLVLLRLLMDFESPYLSKRQANPCQILLRKCYWNPTLDLHLLQDTTALNLLYIQTVEDLEREWIITTPEIRQKLRSLHENGLKKEYLELARQLPLYGCLQFAESIVDYPENETIALISIGNRELSMRTTKGPKIYETKFRVTRMRCWRVTAIHTSAQTDLINAANNQFQNVRTAPTNLQFSFEYLMSKQTLRWITITSSQAMLMSVCLQSMVDELLTIKNGAISPATSGPSQSQSRSDSMITPSSSTPSFSNEPLSNTSTTTSTTSTNSSNSSPTSKMAATTTTQPIKFIAQNHKQHKYNPKILTSASYAAVFFRHASDHQDESVQNEAFEGIGDDDL